MAEEKKTSWLTSAAPLIGAGLDFVSGLGASLFNANQARKNRAFQERMYERQMQDNIRLWNMNNAYNHPGEVLKRMEQAGLNPLLMYEGGTSLTSSSAAQAANAPSGDSARSAMMSNFGQGATQAALIQAQIRNIDADTAQKEQATEEAWTHVDWYQSTKGIQSSILHRNDAKLSFEITKIATETNSLSSMTWKNLEVLDKGIEMLDKNYHLSERDLENRIAYNAASIALGNRQVDATLKQVAVSMYDAITKRQVALADIRKINEEIKNIASSTELNEKEKEVKINEIISGKIGNLLYGHYGVKEMQGTAGAILLLGTSLSGDEPADFKEIREMYERYGVKF